MSRLSTSIPHRAFVITHANGSLPPPWVEGFLGACSPEILSDLPEEFFATLRQGSHFALLSMHVRGASEMPPALFQQKTAEAYRLIAQQLQHCRVPYPVRFWNRVPNILSPVDAVTNRYMLFNAGRFAAFENWYGDSARFDRLLATASGVGHHDTDLTVHALAAKSPGDPISNPRQVEPFHYSRRYGPRPPCFARAMLLRNNVSRPLLLVGGTASVRGEDSLFPGDLSQQFQETLVNLAALISAAMEQPLAPESPDEPHLHFLSAYRELRIYHVHSEQAESILQMVQKTFPDLRRIELVHADLCRRDLLVEIEGLAEI